MSRINKGFCLTVVLTFIISAIRIPTSVLSADLNITPTPPLKPATFNNISTKLNSKVKTLPSGMTYNMKLMDVPELMGKGLNITVPGSINTTQQIDIKSSSFTPSFPNTGGTLNNSQKQNPQIDTSTINFKDLKYPIGSNYMIVDKDIVTFTPSPGEIYIDNISKSAVKVLDRPIVDSASGKRVVPVTKPQFNEIFDSYKIPSQTAKLNKANVSYTIPTIADEDGESFIKIEQGTKTPNIKKPGVINAGGRGFEQNSEEVAGNFPVTVENDALVVTLKNVTIYEYPEPKKEDEKGNKEKSEDLGSKDYNSDAEGNPGYYESKDGSKPDKGSSTTDLQGVNEKDALTVKIKIEEAKLTVHKPEAFANVDIGLWEQLIEIGYQSDVESEITIKGELKFDKVIETCIFGYDIEIPYGRAFIGVFLVFDAKGEVTVKSKIIANSKFKAGLKAQAYLFVPAYVGPFASPEIESINAAFSADGQVTAKAAIVPQVGLEICDLEIGVLQLWLALTAEAKFHLEGEAGVDVKNISASGSIKGEGSLKLGAYAELVGYIFGSRYSMFYKDWKLYDGSWAFGQETSGVAGDLDPIRGVISLYADAYDNSVRGSVWYYDDSDSKKSVGGGNLPRNQGIPVGTSLANRNVKITIKHKDGSLEAPITVKTDSFGEFEIAEESRKNILPTDLIYAEVIEVVKDSAGNDRKLAEKTGMITPTVPFDKIIFTADAFNDVVLGTVSGNYNGHVQVEKINSTGSKKEWAEVQNGNFSHEVQLAGGDLVKVTLPFEGVNFPVGAESKKASLDALKINFRVDNSIGEVNGIVRNLAGELTQSYKGDVSIKSDKVLIGNALAEPQTIRMPMPDVKSSSGVSMQTIETGTSTFKVQIKPSLQFALSIQHEGITKTIVYDPLGELLNKLKNTRLEKEVTNPVEDKTNPVINPADMWKGVWEFDSLGTMVLSATGDKITGSYFEGTATLEAKMSGDKLVGTLNENGETYRFEIYMPQDGKTYRGLWYDGSSSKGNNFKGVKLNLPSSKVLMSGEDLLKGFTGIWYTTYGTLLLSQEGTKVVGSYDSNKYSISGNISGRMLTGTFIEGDKTGEIEFELLPDGSGFEGRYRYDGDEEWSYWSGERHELRKN
jgi:hypothetical protein